MEASGHAAPVEAARAAQLVRLMPQLRRHARPVIGRMIDEILSAAWEAISREGAPPRS